MRRYLLLLPLLAACARLPADPPEHVVEDFYGDHFLKPYYGAPDSARIAQLRPLISDTLAALLTRAAAQRDSDLVRAPDDKPRWADGDIFVSLVEGPSGFYLQYGVKDGRRYKVPVVLQHQDSANGPRTVWIDSAVVIAQRGKWVVDDVMYMGTWDFAQKGTLRQNLAR